MPSSAKPLVLVVTSTLPRWEDDTEPRFVLDLCQALASRYRVLVLAPHCLGAADRDHWQGVEVRRFRYFAQWGEVLAYEGGILPKLRRSPWLWLLVPIFFAALVVAIARVLRRERPVLVHAHWLIPQGLAVCWARGLANRTVPLICTAHGADVFGLRGRFARALQRWVARRCERVGAVSEALREELVRRGVDRDRISLLPMGVAVPDAPTAVGERDSHLIAFAGRLVEKKGVDLLLDAFGRLAREDPQARLCIAGGGPGLERYRQQAAALGLGERAQFLGPVPQQRVRELFSLAAVAVMPSVTARDGDAEGLGLVMLEAMATGCPVVVTDLPAVRGVVRPGENALVFPERDGAALTEALRRLLKDRALAARLGARGRAGVVENFGWNAIAASHAAAYAEAMATS